MELGWLDVCLSVSDVGASRAFYECFGFRRVEGSDAEGWAVMVRSEARIGLYEARHMEGDAFSLNFRGGDVMACVESLKAQGIAPVKGPESSSQGGASAWYKDPDGHLVFLDCAPGEVKKS